MDKVNKRTTIIMMMVEELGLIGSNPNDSIKIDNVTGTKFFDAVQNELIARAAKRVANKLENNWDDEG